MSRCLELKNFIVMVVEVFLSVQLFQETKTNLELPTTEQWKAAEWFLKIMTPFRDVSVLLEGSKYVTISQAFVGELCTGCVGDQSNQEKIGRTT